MSLTPKRSDVLTLDPFSVGSQARCPECQMDYLADVVTCELDHADAPSPDRDLLANLAADLYDLHVATGISLDNWPAARTFVERYYGHVAENGA